MRVFSALCTRFVTILTQIVKWIRPWQLSTWLDRLCQDNWSLNFTYTSAAEVLHKSFMIIKFIKIETIISRKNFGKFENFSKKKCIIHHVELDKLFREIGMRDLKTACRRFGANESSKTTLNVFCHLEITWCAPCQFKDIFSIAYTFKMNGPEKIICFLIL